ncbi:carbohydrate binding domain-containing protein [Candidatus Desantisbacteria bacterium]|nr:carbohydrate binding domain-containing protein [Candidatus Desantisbacteria bacterium]
MIKGTKTGFFHTERISDRWWFITPDGNAFFSLGMYCVRMGGIPENETGKRPYKENCLKKYGSEKKWMEVSLSNLQNWGFNTIGDWSSQSIINARRLPYVIGLNLNKVGNNVIPEGSYGFFPDVFDPKFKEAVEGLIQNRFKEFPWLKDDPWLVGYFTSDEPAWYGSRQRRGALTDDFSGLPKEAPGKKAWKEFIQKRYGYIFELNVAWEKKFKSFDELLETNILISNENIERDKSDFLRLIAEEFGRIPFEILKKYDSNHLILGSRPTRDYPEVIEGLGKYTDVFGMSYYGLNEGYAINPDFDKVVRNLYTYGRKPLILGVLLTSEDSGMPFSNVKTQKDRGISYKKYLKKLAETPFIIGVHWFQYFDPPLNCYDKQASNWGLVRDTDEPYEAAVEIISDANKDIYDFIIGRDGTSFEKDKSFGKQTELKQKPLNLSKNISILDWDFEEASGLFKGSSDTWKFQSWKGGSKAELDAKISHHGKYSLKISGGNVPGWESIGVGIQYSPSMKLIKGTKYKFSVWIKTEEVEFGAIIRIKVKNSDGKSQYFDSPKAHGTYDWQKVEFSFTPQKDNTIEYLSTQLIGQGTAWFDEIKLEVID